jgi:pimeloyl-ACP methyl ester carboxylesterase
LQKLLVLFIHGLAGGDGSWGKFDELIKADSQLSNKVETAHFNYPTKLFRWWPFGWRSMPAQQIADSLMTEIDRRYAEFERILLVCHSMGSLVGKRYIIANIERGLPLRVQGIIFFATPHTGAGLATAANLLSTQHHHLRQLRKDSDFLDLVTRSWVDLKCDSKVRTFYVTGGQDQAVALDMAALGWRPTVENYLGRVTKGRIIEAVREAKDGTAAERISPLKKTEMAKAAEDLLTGSGWLPEPLRTSGQTFAPGIEPASLPDAEGEAQSAHDGGEPAMDESRDADDASGSPAAAAAVAAE